MKFSTSISSRSAFTLIELMIGLLLVAAVGLMGVQYLKSSSKNLRSSNQGSDLQQGALFIQRILQEDIGQVAHLNPSCADNPANASATIDCANIKIRGGIVPLPGVSMEDVDGFSDLNTPANISAEPVDLAKANDGVRLVLYDDDFDCQLNRAVATNPATNQERLWVDSTCHGKIHAGGIYLLVQEIEGVGFSNLFQVTALDNPNTPNQVDIASDDNLFNQVGGLGISGYTNTARIYPVKMVEYAISDADSGLYKRDITPTEADLRGYQDWLPVMTNVENLQFYPLTSTGAGPIEHNRTMSFDVNDPFTDGLEDIRGITPWVIIRSQAADAEGNTTDNPMTSTVESDHYRRQQIRFYVALYNYQE